jgi:hypothetical protein
MHIRYATSIFVSYLREDTVIDRSSEVCNTFLDDMHHRLKLKAALMKYSLAIRKVQAKVKFACSLNASRVAHLKQKMASVLTGYIIEL